MKIAIDELKTFLRYDKDTGHMTWLKKAANVRFGYHENHGRRAA